jgi:hypothetical protein
MLAIRLLHIDKWINYKESNLKDYNYFWNNKLIIDPQIIQLLNFKIKQYMGNARKSTFYSTLYSNINCLLCDMQSIDTWPHLILAYVDPNIYKLKLKKHNNAIWELHKFFASIKTSKCYRYVHVGRKNNIPQDNTVPSWLFPCTCSIKPCHSSIRQ